jgi:hypothetical protein
MAVRTLDYSALTEPVTRADVAAWRSQARTSGQAWARSSLAVGSAIGAGLFAVIFIFVFGGVLASFVTEGIQNGNPIGLVFPSIVIVVIAVVTIGAVRSRITGGGRWQQWYRLDRFARANGMRFQPMDVAPSYPGEIFHIGRDQKVTEHLTTGGRFLDLGNFSYVTGSGRSQTTHRWGFMALALDRAMPNIVLDAKSNNSLFSSNLPVVLDKKQILHLEGDFDEHFTLYCPAEYEQDALYIFTPDLMSLLIDEASPFDVELIDQWMFVYSSRTFALTDPAVLQRLFTIADTVGAKALDQTARYADDRIGDPSVNMVAPQGARLKRGASVLGVVFVVGFLVYWGWDFFSGFFTGQ